MSKCIVDEYGNTKWFNKEGKLHRNDGPALHYKDGSSYWYVNGKCHRTDGPAIEWYNGDKEWHVNNKLHRIDGPAIEYKNGRIFWYINGYDVTIEVNQWINEQNITYPFDEPTQMLFLMNFG